MLQFYANWKINIVSGRFPVNNWDVFCSIFDKYDESLSRISNKRALIHWKG
jgi:hypothetical protein